MTKIKKEQQDYKKAINLEELKVDPEKNLQDKNTNKIMTNQPNLKEEKILK